MGFVKRSSVGARLGSLLLQLSLCLLVLPGNRARAQSISLAPLTQTLTQTVKVSPDLLQLLGGVLSGSRVKVVMQASGPVGFLLETLLLALDARTTRTYQNFNMRAVDMPAGNVLVLATSSLVSYLSLDRPVVLLGHLSNTTGADAVRDAGTTAAATGLDGTGVGIAVIDSGVYASHKSFLDKNGKGRVTFSRDFTGENRLDDAYGHGSHVAGVAAANGRVSNGAYTGVAPGANLINLRVLNSRGLGSASGLLAALDWVASNRSTYNVRVVNLSLGTAAVDS